MFTINFTKCAHKHTYVNGIHLFIYDSWEASFPNTATEKYINGLTLDSPSKWTLWKMQAVKNIAQTKPQKSVIWEYHTKKWKKSMRDIQN